MEVYKTAIQNLEAPNSRPKRRRISQACDYCHKRGAKCRPSGDGSTCGNCNDFDQPCTYLRKPRRRGPQMRLLAGPEVISRDTRSDSNPSQTTASVSVSGSTLTDVPCWGTTSTKKQNVWKAPLIATQATIVDLVDIYFEIVYPIFPFFHKPSFTRRISRADFSSNKSLFAATMAMCALVSGRIRDGSVTNPLWDVEALRYPAPDVFYTEAGRQLIDVGFDTNLDVLRAHAVLSIAAIQNGRIRDMHQHICTYHALVAMDGLHDESNWPQNIDVVEKEERRRLFWSMYTLDIYTSVVWGGISRSREQQSNVAYPMEVDDESIENGNVLQANQSISLISNPGRGQVQSDPRACWLSGWNFITDLYRVLEHALTRFQYHSNRSRRRSYLYEIFDDKSSSVTETSIRNDVMQIYNNLPSYFRETPEATYNAKRDIFGFQAANITASLQLLRMVLFATSGADIKDRCQIVREVVDGGTLEPVGLQMRTDWSFQVPAAMLEELNWNFESGQSCSEG